MAAVATTLPPDPSSPSRARRLVEESLEPIGWRPTRVADASLLASELVTNAVQHAHTDITLRIHAEGGRMRVEVQDASPVLPAMDDGPVTLTESGRGLDLVERLSERWGARPCPSGKVVWFELAAA